MKELDEERERRWKAEQATRKLVNTVKEMQEKSLFHFSHFHSNSDFLKSVVVIAKQYGCIDNKCSTEKFMC